MLHLESKATAGYEVQRGTFVFYYKVLYHYRLAGLVVKASASLAEDPGFESRLRVESYQ